MSHDISSSFQRLLAKLGEPVEVHNAEEPESNRDVPTYQKDGTIEMIQEMTGGQPNTVRDSAGEIVETTMEFRYVPDDDHPPIRDASSSGLASILETQRGKRYRVLSDYEESGGVHVLSVVEE